MFDAPDTPPVCKLSRTVMTKTFKVSYFDTATGKTTEIFEVEQLAFIK
jgi:hypothetical protein